MACLESPSFSSPFASASRAERDQDFLAGANLAAISLDSANSMMPWFRKRTSRRTKRKQRITKNDISEPADFRHCYHAALDPGSEAFSGLPPQWPTVVHTTSKGGCQESTPSTPGNSTNSEKSRHTGEKISHSPPKREEGREKGTEEKSQTPVSEAEDDTGANVTENNAKNLMSSKNSITSSNSTLSLSKRPSPLIRGSDTSLEDTIRLIRKHCQSRSNENVEEEELQAASRPVHGQPEETRVVSRGRFYSQPRSGSFMQLRSSPINRKHVVSYTSSSTSAMAQGTDQLPSSAFCLSAPSEVIQSDLGLYHFNRTDTSSALSHNRISESSGYFGSNDSRVSSAQQVSAAQPSGTQLQFHAAGHTHSRPLDVQGIEEDAELSPVGVPHSTSSQHCFYSLQRHHDSSGRVTGQYAPHVHHRHVATGPPGGVAPRGGGLVSHYGTAPRSHKVIHSSQSTGTPSSEIGSFHRIHECAEISPREMQDQHHHGPIPSKSSNATASTYVAGSATTYRKEGRTKRMTFEHFRMTLELLVNPSDPRREYTDFVKIGEGSTGNVYTARHVATNQILAVKKMDLRKQQRRELLFNEVSE